MGDTVERDKYLPILKYNKEKDTRGLVTDFRVRWHYKQEGFPRTANDAAKGGQGEFIIFLSDDVEIHEGFFDNLLKRFRDYQDVQIVGARLLFPPTSTGKGRPAGKIQHVGIAMNIHADVVHQYVGWSPENKKTQISREVFAVTGAALTIRRKTFQQVGQFDTIYGMGTWEDIDLCLKVRQIGGRIWMDSSVSGYHYTGATVEKLGKGYPLQQNAMIFRNKWANSGLLVFDQWTF
jgi:GT2 family glycosyltransferase